MGRLRTESTCTRILGLGALAILAALVAAPSVRAAPVWDVDVHANPTHYAPGSVGQYWIDVANVGDGSSSGPVTVQLKLPRGLTGASVRQLGGSWNCPGVAGATTVACTTTQPVPRHTVLRNLVVAASVAPNASGERLAIVRLGGGGASAAATTTELTTISPAPSGLGIAPASFAVDFVAPDGLTPYLRAGGHPDWLRVRLDLNSVPTAPGAPVEVVPAGDIRDFEVQLPPGLYGNPTAVAQCSPAQLTGGSCPPSSQVGRIDLDTYSVSNSPFDARSLPLFNVSNPRGAVADLAFVIVGNPVHIRLSLDPTRNYAVVARASNVNQTIPIFNVNMTLWGDPFSPLHDSERCGDPELETSSECPVAGPGRAFLTMPATCGRHSVSLRNYDFWQDSGAFGPEIASEQPADLVDCEKAEFAPRLSARGASTRASSPSGLEVEVGLPQDLSPGGVGTPPMRSLRLQLPDGMRLSAGVADGLDGCRLGEIGLGTNDQPRCPDASRIGEASVITPVLSSPLHGSLYLATPTDNPFGTLFAVYLVLEGGEDRGIVLKLPGQLEIDGDRVGVSFDDLPQLPIEQLDLRLSSGPRALLVAPPSCGPQLLAAEFTSYAAPQRSVRVTSAYRVEEGPDGAACPPPSGRPFNPRLTAGTTDARAGRSAEFVFKLSRSDGEQGLAKVSATLPPGVAAGIAGVATCPGAAIASVEPRPGSGRLEIASPACPASSRVGKATVAVGHGSELLHLPGSVYLSGPVAGAPFSLSVMVPVVAGPFDLGTVVVPVAVQIDPWTGRLRLDSGPLPRSLSGVPVDLRSLTLLLDRPGFVRNPSSCDPMEILGAASSTLGAESRVADRFQVGSCEALPFRPDLGLRFSGGTGVNGHPALRAIVTQGPGDAAVRRAVVRLPAGELLDPARLKTVCTLERFAARTCPASTRRGWARASSPLLDGPLDGGVYQVEGDGRYPDLAVLLDGQVSLALRARLQTARGRIRLAFGPLPDLPLARLELTLSGGRRGLLVNAADLCAAPRRVGGFAIGHNGRRRSLDGRARVSCLVRERTNTYGVRALEIAP